MQGKSLGLGHPSAENITGPSAALWLRREDARLLTGQGRYVHNLGFPEMRHVAFVRATRAHAAFSWPSNVHLPTECVLLRAAELGEHSLPFPNPLLERRETETDFVLPLTHATYVGQPLAIVVAPRPEAARALADLLSAQVVYAEGWRDDDAAQTPTYETRVERGGQIDDARDEDEIEVSISHTQPRVQAMAMEPRASVAQWRDSAITFYTGTQAVTRARDMLTQVLGLAKTVDPGEKIPTAQLFSSVRVIAPDVGGAFGAKASLYPEDFALALAARHLNATLKWSSSRSEEFLSATHGRGAAISGALRISRNGRITGLKANLHFPLGAWLPFSAPVPLRNAVRILPGPYQLQRVDVRGVATRCATAAMNIYRGAGRPEAALLMERLIDEAARTLRVDPLQLRRQNVVPVAAMPYVTASGETIDAGDFDALLTLASKAFCYDAARTEQVTRRANGELVGIGLALYVEPCGQGWESARVTWLANGEVELASGAPAQGQGHETTFAQIAAEALKVPTAQVRVVLGDTQSAPDGIGALASRSVAIGGSAILRACERALAMRNAGSPFPIIVDEKYEAPMEGWSAGCVIAQMRIDAETGAPTIEKIVWADDAGKIVSPILAKGQLLGGLAQGLGQAMMEALTYDRAGQLLSGTLMDYAIPRADDMPPIRLVAMETPTNANALGAKGVGEAGCIGVPAALLNAACDALCAFDTLSLSFPLTSENLWNVLRVPPRIRT